ncbi:MAG: hypothetical protein ACLQJ0_07770 [Steroidobacteraceae bacterium]|jgi:hypothetical protein
MLIEDILFVLILSGLGLGVIAIVAEFISWRSHKVATLKATAALRWLYRRTFRNTRRFATRSQRDIIPDTSNSETSVSAAVAVHAMGSGENIPRPQ